MAERETAPQTIWLRVAARYRTGSGSDRLKGSTFIATIN